MGVIEDIYADTDTEVSESEFREAVAAKVEQMEGLADEETAAMIVAQELAGNEVETVADIQPAMDEVKFIAKVVSVGDLRTFERDDGEGQVINVDAADETGTVRLAFWDGRAEAVAGGEVEPGDVLRVKGRPKDGYSGLEVSVEEAEPEREVDIDTTPGDDARIAGLTLGQSDVNLRGMVLGTDSVRTFDRDDGSEGRVANLTLGDETGQVRVTLWDSRADAVERLDSGASVEVIDGYVRENDGSLELHVGDRGAVEEVDETVEVDPDTTPIEEVSIDETVDISGVVRSTDPKRTFDRDDGSEGQVRNVRIQDDTGDIRVALWGPKADIEVGPGDEVLAADVEIEDGWQDDVEASAGWQSTVAVLDDSAATDTRSEDSGTDDTRAGGGDQSPESASGRSTGDSEEGAVSDGGATGLDAFADGETPETTGETGDRTEFTGTVVQTGEPVVLDDGTETMSVATDQTLRLGEEVTVRGSLVDGRLDADEVL